MHNKNHFLRGGLRPRCAFLGRPLLLFTPRVSVTSEVEAAIEMNGGALASIGDAAAEVDESNVTEMNGSASAHVVDKNGGLEVKN